MFTESVSTVSSKTSSLSSSSSNPNPNPNLSSSIPYDRVPHTGQNRADLSSRQDSSSSIASSRTTLERSTPDEALLRRMLNFGEEIPEGELPSFINDIQDAFQVERPGRDGAPADPQPPRSDGCCSILFDRLKGWFQ